MKHREEILRAAESIQDKRREIEGDEWRLQYHVTAPVFWMNDPNGFSFFQDEYHLFYQHHPYSTEWGNIHWGHVKSRDLVHWEHLPHALAPSEPYDQDGCFSGSAIEKDGKLFLFYTGNTWTGKNNDTDLKQVQCIAVSDDGVKFNKIAENPVISQSPAGDIHPNHFRDPKVWKQEGQYYCVIGSQSNNRVGQVLLYRSSDLLTWEFMNVAAKGRGNMGYMWECPDFFELDGQDVLIMSPQGVEPEGELYRNLHQTVYALGNLDLNKGEFDFDSFHPLDYGFDFYAPQTTLDNEGRRILVAWMAMWESDMPERKDHWAGAMTLPREIYIEDNQLKCLPVKELESLRHDYLHFENILVEEKITLDGLEGDTMEIDVVIDAMDASQFGLKVRCNELLTEQTILTYDSLNQLFSINRDDSGKGPGGIRKAPISLKHNLLNMKLFIDRSSIEVFLQDGEKVMSARIYPSEYSKGVQFFSDNKVKIVKLEKWSLRNSIR